MRRYQVQVEQGGRPSVLNLSHSLRSIDQVAALAEVLPQLPHLTAVVLGARAFHPALDQRALLHVQPALARARLLSSAHALGSLCRVQRTMT